MRGLARALRRVHAVVGGAAGWAAGRTGTGTRNAPPQTPSPTPGSPTLTPAPTFLLHTVVRGDTLTLLARKYDTTGRSIAYWNRAQYPSLDPESAGYQPDNLKRGWVLRVMPGMAYVPPPDDGETGEKVTPTPDDSVDNGTASPDASGSAGPSPSPG